MFGEFDSIQEKSEDKDEKIRTIEIQKERISSNTFFLIEFDIARRSMKTNVYLRLKDLKNENSQLESSKIKSK